MSLEDTNNHLLTIKLQIEELQKIEDIFTLIKFFYEVKKDVMRPVFNIKQLNIYCRNFRSDILKSFEVEFCHENKNENYTDELYRMIYSSNDIFRTPEYKNKYIRLLNIIKLNHQNKDSYYFNIDNTMSAENFLEQINPELRMIYSHYLLDKKLDRKEEKNNNRYKL